LRQIAAGWIAAIEIAVNQQRQEETLRRSALSFGVAVNLSPLRWRVWSCGEVFGVAAYFLQLRPSKRGCGEAKSVAVNILGLR
jgi:hypothetical protein